MAILTDTNTPARLAAKGAQGVYKEHLPISYDKDAEEGRKGYPAAKVSRIHAAFFHLSTECDGDNYLTSSTLFLVSTLPAHLGSCTEISSPGAL